MQGTSNSHRVHDDVTGVFTGDFSPPTKRQKVEHSEKVASEVADTIEIKVVTYEELQEFLRTPPQDLQSAIHSLKEYCTPMDPPGSHFHVCWRLWIEIQTGSLGPEQQECYLNLMLSFRGYDSTAISETSFNTLTHSKEQTYPFVQIYEYSEEDEGLGKPLLSLRLGELSEVLYVRKGNQVSGREMKALAYQFFSFFQAYKILTSDDSQMLIPAKSGIEEFPLSLMLLLASEKPLSKTYSNLLIIKQS